MRRLGLLLLLLRRRSKGLLGWLARLTSCVCQMVMHLTLQARAWTALWGARS